MVVIAASLGVAVLFTVGITVVVLRVRSVERFRHRTIWPPTPLFSATITSASMIEPLFKSSDAASHETVGYVQLLREQRPTSCPYNRCRRSGVCAVDTSACVCHCHHCGIEACSGAGCGCQCGIVSCRNIRLSASGVSSGSKGASTSFARVPSDHHIPSRSPTSGGNNSLRYSGDGCHPPRHCNSPGSEDTREAVGSLPHRVDQTVDVAITISDESAKSVTLVGNELWAEQRIKIFCLTKSLAHRPSMNELIYCYRRP